MIHVQVEHVEGEASLAGFEFSPCAHPSACGIPPETHLFGGLAEPECAGIEQAQLVFLVENGRELAGVFAVVTCTPDRVISIEHLKHVLHLTVQHLLPTECIGLLKVHLVAHHFAAWLPQFTFFLITGQVQPDIVGSYHKLLCAACQKCQQHCHGQEEMSHSDYMLVITAQIYSFFVNDV